MSGLPVPKPKAGELVVRVQAGTINPVDWKFQKVKGCFFTFFSKR